MKKYKINLFALTARLIPYHKEFRIIAVSVTATILWQQLEYWYKKTEGKEFYKFLEPLNTERNGYKAGASWTEELGFSTSEFRNAFSKIGVSYNSKKEYKESKDKFQGKMYCSYYDKISRQTWYFRNNDLIDSNLETLRNSISRDKETQSLEMREPNLEDIQESTTEINTYNKENKREEAKPSFAGTEINEVINFFKGTNPTINFGNRTTRKAAEDLIKQFGYEKTKTIALYAVSVFGKQYAPTITTPYQLKEKLSQLMSYKLREDEKFSGSIPV